MSIYIQREREKNERSTQFKLQWHREAGRGVGAEGVGWGLQKGGGIHLSVMDKRAGERGQFQSTVNGIVVEGGGMEEYSPPSAHPRAVCCYTQIIK